MPRVRSTSAATGVAAGIVAFHPDPDRLLHLADLLSGEVGVVLVFLNSRITPELRHALHGRDHVEIIEADENVGVGAALNVLTQAAIRSGFPDVLMLDQDSRPYPGLVSRLLALRTALSVAGERPAVVAPRLVAVPGQQDSKPPTYRARRGWPSHEGGRPVLFVPTSGSLISIEALRRIGAFRSDYFIDGIDLEWSFRAWSRGLSCWIASDCTMEHRIGSGVIAWPALGFAMPLQQPFRMYCTVRNTIYGLRLPHIPAAWKLAQVAYLPVQILAYALHHRMRPSILAMLGRGAADGLRGRLGVPAAAPNGH